jgi:5-methylcytosine-specific restriction endonuclease McrBC regulatory subunit McrC
LVQRIVRKGLKKSYYRVTENLNSRVKGKILVASQIKENIVKNRFTRTVCSYQEYGFNTEENKFLKLILEFVSSYLSQNKHFFDDETCLQLQHILNYCQPAFEHIDTLNQKHKTIHVKKNVFYKEYEEAIKIGGYILKRFSFNINKTSLSQTSTPPFWIDMSKLFELYVFNKLKKHFSATNEISFHDNFKGGKQTDILIHSEGYKCVIDCKYKPAYENGPPSLEDKRQLAGYTRMTRVYEQLDISPEKLIKGLIIYSHQSCEKDFRIDQMFCDENRIKEYIEFYKLGISLPTLPLPDR